MFEKNMRIAYLLDFYSDALDDHIGSVMRYYYDDDMSLSEVASFFGISRQGVRHLIKKGEEQVEFLESKLKLARMNETMTSAVSTLSEIQQKLADDEKYSNEANEIKRVIESILKGNQDVPKSD